MEIGKQYYVETITHFWTGRLTEINGIGIVLEEAAKIYDTGRFADAMKTGVFEEVEPVPSNMPVTLTFDAIIGAIEWPHKLPREQK